MRNTEERMWLERGRRGTKDKKSGPQNRRFSSKGRRRILQDVQREHVSFCLIIFQCRNKLPASRGYVYWTHIICKACFLRKSVAWRIYKNHCILYICFLGQVILLPLVTCLNHCYHHKTFVGFPNTFLHLL